MHDVLDLLLRALDTFWRQIVFGTGVLFVLGALLYLVQHWTHRFLSRAIGFTGITWLTGWIGTPVHEFSHAIVGKLFGIRITEVRLFAPDPETGVLGYVKYTRPKRRLRELPQLVGTFAMGVAPLFGGALVLWGAWALLMSPLVGDDFHAAARSVAAGVTSGGPLDLLRGFGALMLAVYGTIVDAGLSEWRTWAFLYLALAVGAHLAPSTADLRGGWVGFLVLCGLVLLIDIVVVLAGGNPLAAVQPLARWSAEIGALLVIALVLNVGYLALAAAFATLLRRGR